MTVKNAVVRYIAQKVAKLIQEIGFTPEKIAKLTEDIIKILRGEAGRGHHQDSERMAVGRFALHEWVFIVCTLALIVLLGLFFTGGRSSILYLLLFLVSSGMIVTALLHKDDDMPPSR